MNQQVFEPAKDLADLVMCYWTLESTQEHTPTRNTIVPDGTIKMIFHYADPYKHHPANDNSYLLPRCFVVGQLTEPYVVEPMGRTGTFFVRFHPNGFLPFATLPIKEMENSAVSLAKLFGEGGVILEQKILNADSTEQRIFIVETFLRNRLTEHGEIDQIISSTIDTILALKGQLSVNELSEQVNVNRRQLVRKFSPSIGLSPKQLSKTIRLQETLKTLLNQDVSNLTNLAYENEYYDQAHFIKDFKEFTGLTPKEFYGDQLKMSTIFDNKN